MAFDSVEQPLTKYETSRPTVADFQRRSTGEIAPQTRYGKSMVRQVEFTRDLRATARSRSVYSEREDRLRGRGVRLVIERASSKEEKLAKSGENRRKRPCASCRAGGRRSATVAVA